MTKKQKVVVLVGVVVLAAASVGGYYVLQKDKEKPAPVPYQPQSAIDQTAATPAATDQTPAGLHRAVYSACSDGRTIVYSYDTDSKKTTELFSDQDKSYALPCNLSSVNHGTIENNVLSFDAKDRKTNKDLKLTIDLDAKKEMLTPYDPNDQSKEKTEKAGNYEVITSTVKKSPDGGKILFAARGADASDTDTKQGLFLSDINYNGIKQINNFSGAKCVNDGNLWDAYGNDYGWVSDKKIYINDSALQCAGAGSFLFDADGGNPIKAADDIVVVPQQRVLSADNFVAVVNDGTGNRIVLVNVDSGKIAKEMIGGTQVTVSADGSKMFYEVHSGESLDKSGNLFVANIDGTDYQGVPAGSEGLLHILGWMK